MRKIILVKVGMKPKTKNNENRGEIKCFDEIGENMQYASLAYGIDALDNEVKVKYWPNIDSSNNNNNHKFNNTKFIGNSDINNNYIN